MATDADFGDFTVAVVHKPVGGVTEGEIPAKLAAYLAEHTPAVLKSADHELILTAENEDQAKRLAGYARPWGARQTPALRITKVANGQRYPRNVARLKVQLDEEVPQENRPGRPNPERAPAPAPADKK